MSPLSLAPSFPPPPDKYAIRFIPRENGLHSIDVKFNGSHIPGSPFQVRVGEPGQSGDAGLVSAYGAGLEKGTTGGLLSLTHLGLCVVCTPAPSDGYFPFLTLGFKGRSSSLSVDLIKV